MERKTNEQYLIDISNRNIVPLESYVSSKVKIKHQCSVCSNIWEAQPNNILQGRGCPSCSYRNMSKSNETYRGNIKDMPLTNIEPYISNKTKIEHKCDICNKTWKAIPSSILQGSGCPACNVKANTKSDTQYISELKNRPFKSVEPYINGRTKIKHQCNICDNTWEARPKDILNGNGCTTCAKVVKQIHWEGERTKELRVAGLKIPCSLYILDSKNCIKVGISKDVTKRLKQRNTAEFECTILEEYKLNAWDAVVIEQEIHHKFKRYKSPLKFSGYKELYPKEELQVIKAYIAKLLG